MLICFDVFASFGEWIAEGETKKMKKTDFGFSFVIKLFI